MTVKQAYETGLTGRSWTATFTDATTLPFTAWTDDEGYDYLAGVNGLIGGQEANPAGWLWGWMQTTGKTVLDAIAYISPGPTLPAPVPPMP